MILADKIINERKKNGWSQEDLAEKLSVSRQSVSKWESAQATPDLQKLLKMAELFGVSTDYLLKDEYEEEAITSDTIKEDAVSEPPARKVTLAEANEYLDTRKHVMPHIANAVSLCILSPIAVVVLAGLAEEKKIPLTEDVAYGIGVITLLIMVAIAVFTFITKGTKLNKFAYLTKEVIDTEYGVDGMVKEKKSAYEATASKLIGIGVILCILSVIPVVMTSVINAPDYVACIMVGILLAVVAFAVNIFVRVGSRKIAYSVLLQEAEFSPAEKKTTKKYEALSTCYWCLCTIIFLVIGFVFEAWMYSWIVWPVGGILYGALKAIVASRSEN